jgi:F-box protein 11
MNPTPRIFFSYARQVDEHDAGRLTRLRERLQGEIRVQTGLPVEIFQDISEIRWGDRWRKEILGSLSEAYFLIPVITPGYFLSEPCREEYEAFKERQARIESAGGGFILPIYYVQADELSDPAWREGNEWATEIHAHQWADWRRLRLEPWESPEPHRRIEEMALQFKARLKNLGFLKPTKAVRDVRERPDPALAPSPEPSTVTVRLGSAPEPRRRELTVDATGKGQFRLIGDAVRAAGTDDIVLVKPGTYREGVELDKSLTLIGDGPRETIVVEPDQASALQSTAPFGRVANLTLRQLGGDHFCVDISAGQIELEHCDISSQGLTCLAVRGGADPIVRRNRIHDGVEAGILVYENGRGTFEDNEIFGNALAAVSVLGGANPTVRRNRIHDGQGGIHVYENSRGTFEDNDIVANALAGIEVREGADPTVRRNQVRDGKQDGIFVYKDGRGTFEDNQVVGNAFEGVAVRGGANPTLRRNRITRNGHAGISVYDEGRGTFLENDLRGNGGGPWDIAGDCLPHVTRKGNVEA